MCDFSGLGDVQETLRQLATRENGPFVKKLPRQVGRKEPRYAHLFCGDSKAGEEEAEPDYPSGEAKLVERVEKLEKSIEEIKSQIERINQRLA
jgi:uncharacterized protein YceH (UPF0502 family)